MDELNELEASLSKTSVQTHGPGIKASSWERERGDDENVNLLPSD
jgi:hypothetical protein